MCMYVGGGGDKKNILCSIFFYRNSKKRVELIQKLRIDPRSVSGARLRPLIEGSMALLVYQFCSSEAPYLMCVCGEGIGLYTILPLPIYNCVWHTKGESGRALYIA